MAYKLMFFVQTFDVNSKNKLVPRHSSAADSAELAQAKAKWMAERAPGVVAFSQMVDESAQDAEEPVLLAAYGRVPAEVLDLSTDAAA